MSDEKWMRLALNLSEKGRFTAAPNPWVGCAVVKEGQLIGKGYHKKPGDPHAEVYALQQAGSAAKGATVFVTLEPCSHHGRTAPCVDALIKAGISRVVIGTADPDPQVSGLGIKKLKEAGITVVVAILEEEVQNSLQPYLHHRKTGLPFVVIKTATSLDGKIAARDGTSQWITDEKTRQDAHLLRAASQAIAVGTNTALTDEPKLTVRHKSLTEPPKPLRVVFDLKGRILQSNPLFDQKLGKTLVVTDPDCSKKALQVWDRLGIEALFTGKDLLKLLQELGKRGVLQLLIEGGAALQGAFIKQGLFNQIVLYRAPLIIGGQGIDMFKDLPYGTLTKAIPLKHEQTTVINDCLKSVYRAP